MDAATTAEKIRCLEERIEALRARITMVSIERKVLADRMTRNDGDVALLHEEIRRIGYDIRGLKPEAPCA